MTDFLVFNEKPLRFPFPNRGQAISPCHLTGVKGNESRPAATAKTPSVLTLF